MMPILRKYSSAAVAFGLSIVALFYRYQYFKDSYPGPCIGDAYHQHQRSLGPLLPFWSNNVHYSDLTSYPGYYLLGYPFAQNFGCGELGLQIPNIISTMLGLFMLWVLCRLHCKTIVGYIVAFSVVTFNATMVQHAFEFRPYAVLPTFVLICLYIWDLIIRREAQLKIYQKVFIVLLFIYVSIFHAFGEFIMCITLLYVSLAASGEKPLKSIIGHHYKFIGLIFLLTMPLWVYYGVGNPMNIPNSGFLSMPSAENTTFHYIPNPIVDIIGFLKGVFGNLIGKKALYFLLFTMTAFFFVPTKERNNQIGFFLILIILPLQLICLAAVVKNYWFIQRQFVWVVPLLAFFLGWQWDSVVCYFKGRLKL